MAKSADGVIPAGSTARAWAALVPVAGLVAILVVTWGYFLGRTGFYWDDWQTIWVHHELGVGGINAYFGFDRPFYGYVYSLLLPLFGAASERWFLLELLFLLLTAWTWHRLLLDLWPEHRLRAWIATALLLVHPVFTHHGIAFTYIQHFMSSFCFVVSLRASIAAMRSVGAARLAWTGLAATTALLSFLLVEYFVGLELARPWVLYLAARHASGIVRPRRERVRDVALSWIPTLLVFAGFVAFQFFGQTSLEYRDAEGNAAEILARPLQAISDRGTTGLRNLLAATVLAWVRPFEPHMIAFTWGRSVVASWFAMGCAAAAMILAARLVRMRDPEGATSNAPTTGDLWILAALLLVAGGLPAAFGDLYADFEIPSRTRFALPLVFGSSLLFASLVTALSRKGVYALCIAATVVGASSALQFRATNDLAAKWQEQRTIFWQMAWRFPDLIPGTTVFADGLPELLDANQAATHLNLLYGDAGNPGDLDYFILDLHRERVRHRWARVPALAESTKGRIRKLWFRGDTSRALVMWLPDAGSIRFVDGRFDGEIPRLGTWASGVAALSSPERVLGRGALLDSDEHPRPAGPLLDWLGPEPPRGWSYSYQKAELARQLRDWERVIALETHALDAGLSPDDPSEWMPFIEARLRRGDVARALAITKAVLARDGHVLASLARLWLRVANETVGLAEELVRRDRRLARRLGLDAGGPNDGS